MIVAQLMTPNPITVAPSDSLESAYQKMKLGRFRQVPVVDREKLIGIVTDRDMRQYLGHLDRTTVESIMSALPLSVCPSTPVEQAADLLATNKIGSLPVVNDGKLVGIITASDMLHALQAILGTSADGSVRIDLDVSGSGEISAAISLLRSVCPVLCMGTYRNGGSEGHILYVRMAGSGAEDARSVLERHGFKVLAVHRESDLRETN